jgi:hypothetical protein
MALTAQNIVDVRRYCGYSVSGDTTSFPAREFVYTDRSLLGMSIEYRLAHLQPEEENRITGFFLPNLAAREQEIQDASCNLDTDQAAVWRRNRSEVGDRRDLFTALRIELCDFLGFAPGPGITRATRLVRA